MISIEEDESDGRGRGEASSPWKALYLGLVYCLKSRVTTYIPNTCLLIRFPR
jgi:hypothetical protein